MDDVNKIKDKIEEQKNTVTYNRASFSRRIFSFLFDFLCSIILTLGLMAGVHEIIIRNTQYQEATSLRTEYKKLSHIYVYSTEKVDYLLLTDFYQNNTSLDTKAKNAIYESSLTLFFTNDLIFDQTDPNSGISIFNSLKLGNLAILDSNGETYFAYKDISNEEIVQKSNKTEDEMNVFYVEAIDNYAYQYLNYNDAYYNASNLIFWYATIYVFALPFLFSLIVFFYVMPLILKRGRKTLGKLILKLSVVSLNGFYPSFWRFTARFSIFFFVEIILSFATFGLPLIVTFTMFVISKTGQSFHDYLLGTFVIDSSDVSTFKNMEEYRKRMENKENFSLKERTVDF